MKRVGRCGLKMVMTAMLGMMLSACGGGGGGSSPAEDGAPVGDDSSLGGDDSVAVTVSSPVLRTGQTKSYDEDGNEVTDGSVKDDGYYQAGVERSYSRDDSTEIVTDNMTDLMWQDDFDAGYVKKQWLTQANYDAGNYNDTSGDTAATYCRNLTLGGYEDWTLPTIKQLFSILTSGVPYPSAVIDTVFQNVQGGAYWSITDFAISPQGARYVKFDFGDNNAYKYASNNVRCVRER